MAHVTMVSTLQRGLFGGFAQFQEQFAKAFVQALPVQIDSDWRIGIDRPIG